MNVQEQKAKDINIINYIYDEEFINLINSLSSAIKKYFKDFKQVINTFKAQTENINDQTLCAKSDINDILLYLTQTRSKVAPTSSEKFIRDKGQIISEKLSKIGEIKINLTQLIKASEVSFLTFYDNAKEIFKKMKTTRSNKIDEINAKINFERYIEKENQDKPSEEGMMNSQKGGKQNTYSQQSLDSSQNSIQKYNTCNTVGNTINVKNVNLLSQSSEDCIKKNETLISEITLMKFKHTELFKENQILKNIIANMKSNANNSKDNKESQSLQSSTNSSNYNKNKSVISNVKDSFLDIYHTKSRSLPKKNNGISNNNNNIYISCHTIENDNRNKKCNPLLNSITSKKKSSQMISKPIMPSTNIKRAFSIDNNSNNKKIDNSNSNIKITMNSSTIPIRTENNMNPTLSNSNSTNNTICINTTHSNSLNNSFSTQYNLANLVLGFIVQMKLLQESISNHQDNVKEMKKNFELKKKELIKLSERILDSGSNLGILQGTSTTLTAINSLTTTPRSTSKQIYQLQQPQQSQLTQQTQQQPLLPNKCHLEKITKIENELAQIRVINQELEKKIKNEKSISSLYEEKLNEEKAQNKELNELIIKAQDQIEEYNQVIESNKASIESFEKSNKDLMELVSIHKTTITKLENDILNYIKSNEKLQKENSDQMKKIGLLTDEKQIIVEECNTNKNEIGRLKALISECNQNIITISNTNESIISEKDLIIKKHSDSIAEKKKEINEISVELKNTKEKVETLENKLDEITENKEKAQDNKSNFSELINNLNEKIEKYEKELLSNKQENRDLMNKISQIKNEYLNYNEEKEVIHQQLIKLNDETNINLLDIQSKLSKHNQSQHNKKSERTQKGLIAQNNSCSQIIRLNLEMRKVNKALEDKINEMTLNDTLLQKLQELKKELSKTQEENDKLKQIISLYQGKESVSNRNNPNKTLSNINEQNSNFIDDDLYNVSGIFLEEKKEEKEEETR